MREQQEFRSTLQLIHMHLQHQQQQLNRVETMLQQLLGRVEPGTPSSNPSVEPEGGLRA